MTTYHSACPHCGKAVRYRAQHFGKKVRCPNKQCNGLMLFPSEAPDDAEATVLMKVPEPAANEVMSLEEVAGKKKKPAPSKSKKTSQPEPPPKPAITFAAAEESDEDIEDESIVELDELAEYEVEVEVEPVATPQLQAVPGLTRNKRPNRANQITLLVCVIAIPLLIAALVLVLMRNG